MKTTKSSSRRAVVLAVSTLAMALLACNLNPVLKAPVTSIPTADVIFTAPEDVMALATDKEENVYVVTIGGNVLKIAPDGKSEQIYSGLERCGFSRPAITTLPNGDVIVSDCVDKKNTLLRIDQEGNKTPLMQLEEVLLSMTSDASGNIYLGLWLSEGNITVGEGYLKAADEMWGQVSVLGQDGQLNTLYEGGIPLSIAASGEGELYAVVWGNKGRFNPKSGDYYMCASKESFWVMLSDQVEIRQVSPGQKARSVTNQLSPASSVAATETGLVFTFGFMEGDRCAIYQIGEGQNPQRLAFATNYAEKDITGLAVSDKNLYFSDRDGSVYRVGLKDLVVASEAAELPVVAVSTMTVPPTVSAPSPTPAFTQPPPAPPTATPVPPPISVTDTPQPTPTPVPPSPTAMPPVALQVTQLALYEDASNHFAWSPDSKLLVIAGYNMDLYDVQTLKKTQEIRTGAVREVVFSPDGTMLASASHDGVKLWDTAGWGELRTLAGSGDTESVAFSPDGKMLATGTGSTIKLWDVAAGNELRTLPGSSGRAVAFSPDGRLLAASGGVAGQDIKLWDVASGSELPALTGHSNWINSLAFSPDGRLLASGSVDGTVRLWDAAEGRQARVLTGHTGQVDSVAFSSDGRLLASASWDLTVRLWDVASGKELVSLTGHASWISCVAFSPDGTMLASGSGDRMLLWRIEYGAAMPEPTPTLSPSVSIVTPVPLSGSAISPGNIERVAQLQFLESDNVKQIAWSPDGKLLAIGTYHIYFYDAQTLEQIYVMDSLQWVNSIAFSPDGTLLASASMGDSVQLWEVGGWGELRILAGSGDTESVAFSPDGRMLATATGSTVKLWDVASGNELRTLPAGPVRTVAFSPDGRTLAASAGVAGQEIKLWDVESGNELRTLTGHSNWINSVVFSPDGQTLASGSVDNTVRLWDVASGRQVRALTGHTNQVESVAFSPDGRLLASASWDLTVKLWDVASGNELRSLTGHTGWVTSVAFSPDGAVLASGSETVRLWGLAP
jgi:WD40 repeat protein